MSAEKLREAAKVLKEMHRVAGPRNYTNTFDSEEIGTVFDAADACTTLAAQMESATHGFKEWAGPYPHAAFMSIKRDWENKQAAWHAAQAAMQAKLDAANERVKDLEANIHQNYAQAGDKSPCYYCGKPVNNLSGNPTLWAFYFPHEDEPGKCKPHHMGCVMDRLDALATAERNVELLRKEVRRMEDQIKAGVESVRMARADRSPEVRALVESAGPSGATG